MCRDSCRARASSCHNPQHGSSDSGRAREHQLEAACRTNRQSHRHPLDRSATKHQQTHRTRHRARHTRTRTTTQSPAQSHTHTVTVTQTVAHTVTDRVSQGLTQSCTFALSHPHIRRILSASVFADSTCGCIRSHPSQRGRRRDAKATR